MFILTVNDLDLRSAPSSARRLHRGIWMVTALLCLLILAGCCLLCASGALIHARRLPACGALGMSFVWLGIAIILMPTSRLGAAMAEEWMS
jgi:hypothetical protein